jgi:argininosuccinate synthase
MKEKVVLAYSGGLDTSFCVKYLSNEKGLDVYSAIANTGGFSQAELDVVEQNAYKLGVVKHTTIDVTDLYYRNCIKYMIFGNILKNNTYPLSVSSERIFQALAIVKYAREIGAKYIAHGSTGAGNDQVRFDFTFQILAPEIQIITPIRDLTLSREAEIEYLKKAGVERDWTKMEYSINKGLWGTSVGGKETLTSDKSLPDAAYPKPIASRWRRGFDH